MAYIDPKTINYADEIDVDYVKGLDKSKTYSELLSHGEIYRLIFPDAYKQICKMGESEFQHFRDGLKMERKGYFAGEDFMEKFGDILLPEMLLRIGAIAHQFKVPFELAWKKYHEAKTA